VAVPGFAADESFIDLDNAAQLFGMFDQRNADAVAHVPGRFVRAEAHVAHDLQRAHAFLAGEHQVDDAKPLAERLIRVLENRADDMGEAVTVRRAPARIARTANSTSGS
jgi:hypothetical protein